MTDWPVGEFLESVDRQRPLEAVAVQHQMGQAAAPSQRRGNRTWVFESLLMMTPNKQIKTKVKANVV